MTVTFVADRENDRVFGQIENTGEATRRGLRQGMFRSGHTLIKAASQEILHGNKTGITYIRRDRAGRRRRHQASAPGETHANMTGTLRRSLSFQLTGVTQIEFGYGVSAGNSAPEYAAFVEFGTTRMRARPSLLNTLNAQQGNLVQHMRDEIVRALNAG